MKLFALIASTMVSCQTLSYIQGISTGFRPPTYSRYTKITLLNGELSLSDYIRDMDSEPVQYTHREIIVPESIKVQQFVTICDEIRQASLPSVLNDRQLDAYGFDNFVILEDCDYSWSNAKSSIETQGEISEEDREVYASFVDQIDQLVESIGVEQLVEGNVLQQELPFESSFIAENLHQ